jgi:hypothetical protein
LDFLGALGSPLKLLTLPAVILTLGLFLAVVNAAISMLVSRWSDKLEVNSFGLQSLQRFGNFSSNQGCYKHQQEIWTVLISLGFGLHSEALLELWHVMASVQFFLMIDKEL